MPRKIWYYAASICAAAFMIFLPAPLFDISHYYDILFSRYTPPLFIYAMPYYAYADAACRCASLLFQDITRREDKIRYYYIFHMLYMLYDMPLFFMRHAICFSWEDDMPRRYYALHFLFLFFFAFYFPPTPLPRWWCFKIDMILILLFFFFFLSFFIMTYFAFFAAVTLFCRFDAAAADYYDDDTRVADIWWWWWYYGAIC